MQKFRTIRELMSTDYPDTIIISHRGCFRSLPENSIEAILEAWRQGAHLVEFDVQKTSSGTLYLMHDDTTERTTNRTGATAAVTDTEFDNIFLKSGAGGVDAALTSIRVPLLRDALAAVRGKVNINIDTKHPRDLNAVADLVVEMDMADQVLIKTLIDPTDPDLSIQEQDWFKQLSFMPVVQQYRDSHYVEDVSRVVDLFCASMVEVTFTDFQQIIELGEKMAQQGVRIWINTLDCFHHLDYCDARALTEPDAVWGRLIQAGVGALQTDYTAELLQYLRKA